MSKKDNLTVKVAAPTLPIFGLLGVVFVTLKLLGHVTWSWWWVTAPFWVPFTIFAAMLVLVLCIICVAAIFGKVFVKRY